MEKTMEMRGIFLTAILSFFSFPVASATIVLDPSDDTYITSDGSGVLGAQGFLSVRASASGVANAWGNKTYIKYDLSSVKGPVSSVKFSFNYRTYNQGTSPSHYEALLFGLNDAGAGEDWSESSMSWNNAPANVTNVLAGGSSIDNSAATFLNELAVPANIGWPEWEVSNQALVDFVNADTNDMLTLILVPRDRDGDAMELLSKEDTNHPSLHAPRLTLTTVPLPPAIFLFISALVGMGLMSRGKKIVR